jgi:hypothetical protein
MRKMTRARVGLGAIGAVALAVALVAPSASADYAPGAGDVVGVGSDTVQDAGDFVADGDFLGDQGYNSAGNLNRVVNFDATADANVRLAYGLGGPGGTNACAPGTGGTAGTGNQNSGHTDSPCVLNPTIVIRAGTQPVLRPNGSGAGLNALLNDRCGANPCGTGPFQINYVRRSSAAGSTAVATAVTEFGGAGLDSVTIGNDGLAILSSSTTNAVALSAAQLKTIYECTVTTWNDPSLGGASATTIKPLLPQVGSGTRTSFLAAINVTTPGSCVSNVEENDPEAIDQSGVPADAIEPMSSGRLNLFQGRLGNNTANGVGGYFNDPSCAFGVTAPAPACTTGKTLAPNVKYWTTGTPLSGTLFNINRPLYIYFRDVDVFNDTTVFQPGGTLNWVRTLFYNPCQGTGHTTGCTTVGGITYGPGGRPFVATSAGQALVSAAGISPTYATTVGGP